MNLRNLAPIIQERILSKAEDQRTPMTLAEFSLRRISGILDWREQIRRFEELCEAVSGGKVRNGLPRATLTSRS
jgi:hypothetical protein